MAELLQIEEPSPILHLAALKRGQHLDRHGPLHSLALGSACVVWLLHTSTTACLCAYDLYLRRFVPWLVRPRADARAALVLRCQFCFLLPFKP